MSLRLIRRLLWLAVALVGIGLAFMLLREPPQSLGHGVFVSPGEMRLARPKVRQ